MSDVGSAAATEVNERLARIEDKLDSLCGGYADKSKMVFQLREQVAVSQGHTSDIPVTPFPGFPRPVGAIDQFLRIVMVNDVYKLANYPPLAQMLRTVKAASARHGCKVISVLNGDFLSPCIETSLDGGKAMSEVLNLVPMDYVCFGNHEFDIGVDLLKQRTKTFQGTWLNGNISSPKFHGPGGEELPQYAMLEVGKRKVCLTGVTTDNLDIYRPGSDPQIGRPAEAIAAVATKADEKEGGYDVLIPLTHQTIAQDRAMAEELPKLASVLKGKVPVICGGHEHEVFIEDNAGSLIVKVGADAVNAGVIDMWWTADGQVRVAVSMLPLAGFEAPWACPCATFVRKEQDMLNSVMRAEILNIPKGTSTERTRYEPSELASQLLLQVKKALPGVDIVLLQGGAVRGKAKYEAGPFTYGGLMKEIAFGTEMAIIKLPGKIIAESIANTRSTPEKEAPNYLHADSECTFDPEDVQKLTHIDKKPLEPEREYTVSLYQFLLGGMNEIEPLLSYVREHVQVPELERCLPAKVLIMESCMKAAWKRILGDASDLKQAFHDLDSDKSGHLCMKEIHAKLKDLDKDRDPNNDVSVDLVDQLLRCLDVDGDGKVSFQEFEKIAQV
eukprot:TRINITY_DN73646_c0_g1_i1.p1 TRINITY_DN73646_c0_g1~~TRINITY_DN73646_c0_g1_i1.p1  ORF type:complete len:614 (+),score=95.94 TRINITY_DN73646_c0_g1_i1:99-1940(+)